MTTTSSNNFTGLYGSDGNATTASTSYGNANVVALLATSTDGANTVGNISATGNVTADYFIGDGSQLTNIPAGNIVGAYGNANVSAYLASGTNTANMITSGNVSGTYVLGDGSQLSNLPAGYSNAQVSAYLASGTNSANMITSGNVSGSYLLGNGSQITGLPAGYSNAQVSSYLASGTNSANIITSANISGSYILGNGSQLTGLPATYGNANVAAYLPTNTANVGAGNLSVTGNQSTQGTISATGNIETAGYFVGNFAGNITGNISVPGSNTQVLFNNQGNVGAVGGFTYDKDANAVGVLGTISAQGNITAAYMIGNGSLLSNITGANVTGTVTSAQQANVANSANAVSGANVSGNVANAVHAYFADSANAVSGANVSGNVADAVHAYFADSANAVAGANVSGTVASAQQANVANVANSVAGGNVTGTVASAQQANVANTANSVSGSNVSGAVANAVYATSAGTASTVTDNAQANITSVGVLTSLSVNGNVTGNYFIGNGSQLTGVVGTYGNTQVRDYLASGTNTANIITTGNISGSYILGNGSQLTGLPAGYSNAEVAAYLASGNNSSNIITTGNVSGNYYIGNGSLLTGVVATSIGVLPSLSVTGNIDAGNVNSTFYGNGAGLTNITGGNVTGVVANANYATTAGSATTAQYVTANAQANITSVGTLTSLSVSGNITGGNVITGDVYTSNITGAAGQNVTITADGTGDVHLDADSIRIGDNNTDAIIVTHGTGDLILRTNEGSGVEGNIRLYDGANGNIDINPNGSGAVNITGTTGLRVSSGISATGNVTGNYIIGNGSLLTSLTGANVSGTVANATYAVSAGTATSATTAGTVTTAAQPNITSVGTLTSVTSSGNISTTGNVSGAYFLGNGSQLTGITSSYGNANVVANLAALGTNPVSTTGNVTASYFIGNGALLTSINASNIVGAYGNANVSNFLANGFGSNTILTTGNITGGNLLTGGASGNITGVNYVNANYFVGNGALLTGVANLTQIVNGTSNVNIGGTNGPANVVVAGTLRGSFNGSGLAVTGIVSSTGNINGANIVAASDVTANGNIAGTNLNLSGGITATGSALNIGTITATGNIRTTGGYFVGDGGLLSNVAAGASIQNGTSNVVAYANANVTTSVGGTANVITVATTGQFVSGVVSATGNITGGNMLGGIFSATGNITTGQSTIIGTANTTGGVGNIILSGKNIATDMIRNPDSGNTTFVDPSRILIGTGYGGNTSAGILYNTATAARLWVADSYSRGNNALGSRGIVSSDFVTLSANVSNFSWRLNGIASQPIVGGGPSGNTVNGGVFGIVGITSTPQIGGGLTGNLTALGNTTAQFAAGMFAGTQVAQGSNIGNALNIVSFSSHQGGGGVSSFANTMLGFTNYSLSNVTPTTYISYHQPSNVATYGISMTNSVRAATNYYFLKNDDAAAQAQIGSLRSYSEFNYTNTATSGAVTIDKNNAQVQQVNLTGNVTSLTYSNFVSSASDSVNTDEQADTVTIIFNQGATGGYGVTFPSGSAYKYAGGTNTLSATTANSVSLVAITAIRISGTTTYLTTISPAFT